MASYTATRIKHATLTAATVDTVTLAADYPRVEVTNRDATNPLYVRLDGAAPTVAGDDTLVVPPNTYRVLEVATAGNTVVKLISAGAAPYSVTGL
jgi:hypothetical protein